MLHTKGRISQTDSETCDALFGNQRLYCHHPFGMVIEERSKSHQHYRFGFNGQEKNAEVSGIDNFLDFEARMFSTRVGTFSSLDPKRMKRPMVSPYVFAQNSPLMCIDKNGEEAWVVIWASQSSRNGKSVIGHTGIVVKDYREVQKEIEVVKVAFNPETRSYDVSLSSEIVTTYEPTGTYTYYEMYPASGINYENGVSEGDASYEKWTFKMVDKEGAKILNDKSMENWISKNDISARANRVGPDAHSNTEHQVGYKPDGILRLDISAESTVQTKYTLEATIDAQVKYDLFNNNCASFVCRGISHVVNVPKEVNTTTIASWKTGFPQTNSMNTPNMTFNYLAKSSGTSVVKDASSLTQEDFEDAVIDPELKSSMLGK